MAQMTTKVLTIMCGDLGIRVVYLGADYILWLEKFYSLHTVAGLAK